MLDTNILIRAHNKSTALARKLLITLLQQSHRLVLSNEILSETVRVLRYPGLQNLYGLSEQDLLSYVQFLQSVADMVILNPHYRAPFLQDPKDLHVLQTAELGHSDVLCTQDSDFSSFAVVAYGLSRGIEICSEASLWRRLRPETR